ncbi:unnamed protein product [Victoria cruziana]
MGATTSEDTFSPNEVDGTIVVDGNDVIEQEGINANEANDAKDIVNIGTSNEDNNGSRAEVINIIPNVASEYVPLKGMKFESDDKAYWFYNTYANRGGFDTRVRDSKKRHGVVYYKRFVCNKQGFKKQRGSKMKEYDSTRTGCKAWMSIELDSSTNKWFVRNIEYAHNHSLHSPSKANFQKSSKKMNTPQKNAVNTMIQFGVKVIDTFALEAGGMENVPFAKERLYKHIKKLSNSLNGKDAQTMVDYFKKKSNESEDFFFSMQYDENGHIGNCCWVDAMAREEYHYFGDVVLFDTTYKKNKYHMPLALFTGVNHHGQCIIFGCALLVDEKKESFKWLFEQWLHCMGGQAPVSFFTDQNLAMTAAVKEVFPNTMHRLCNWHIYQKVPTYIEMHRNDSQFKHTWDMWFFNSETIEEFESRWQEMNLKYPQLESMEWVTNLWKERTSWAQPYFSDIFMAVMSVTQHSESLNHYFKNWVNAYTTLSGFIVKYEEAINDQRFSERALDYKMNNEQEPTITCLPLESHLRDTFTPEIYKKYLKQEFLNCTSCSYNVTQQENGVKEFQMKQRVAGCVHETYKYYTITYDPSNQGLSSCQCKRWERLGIVCCHMLTVINAEHIHTLPSKYVLKRWTRHAKKSTEKEESAYELLSETRSSLLVKKNLLQMKANKCVKKALSDDTCYEYAMDVFDKLLVHIEDVKEKMTDSEQTFAPNIQPMQIGSISDTMATENGPVHAEGTTRCFTSGIQKHNKPHKICGICKNKGDDSCTCPRRMKERNSEADTNVLKQRICHSCGGTGHDKRNCPKSKDDGNDK